MFKFQIDGAFGRGEINLDDLLSARNLVDFRNVLSNKLVNYRRLDATRNIPVERTD